MLNTLIHAAENNLAAWIKQHTSPDFDCIYNDIYSAENGGYPPTQNGDIRSLFMLFTLMAMQN